jgi:hypothetical protein
MFVHIALNNILDVRIIKVPFEWNGVLEVSGCRSTVKYRLLKSKMLPLSRLT